MRKYLPVALALAAAIAGGTAPALARTRHHSPAHTSAQLYMYAPSRATPFLAPTPDLQVYPNPIQRTGSAANVEDLGPGYY
ncbi:MAG TPA: hypothetical protein VGJ20_01115 [Xanthobacteraceae bacterium]|jgi:hypothetical protein